MESRFAAIAQRALRDAEEIDASFEAFVEGLKEMSDEINGRLQLAEEELEYRQREDPDANS